jgi:hypothetical protein
LTMASRTTSTADAASALGMSPQALNKHARTKGAPCDLRPDGSRLFDVDELREWMTTTGSVQANGSNRAGAFAGGGTTALDLQLALKAEQLRELQLRNDERQGKLVDFEEYKRRWLARVMVFKGGLEAVPTKATNAILSALQLPADRHQVVSEIIRRELQHTMRGFAQ